MRKLGIFVRDLRRIEGIFEGILRAIFCMNFGIKGSNGNLKEGGVNSIRRVRWLCGG